MKHRMEKVHQKVMKIEKEATGGSPSYEEIDT